MTAFLNSALFAARGEERVDPRRAADRHIQRQERRGHEEDRYEQIGDCVRGRRGKEQIRIEARCGRGSSQSKAQSHKGEHHVASEDDWSFAVTTGVMIRLTKDTLLQSLLPLFQRIQEWPISTSLRESAVMFPVIESLHVLGLTVSVGLVVVVDLRLIGWRFQGLSPNAVLRPLRPWLLGGFALMVITGSLLFMAEAEKCYLSRVFRLKIAFLLAAATNALVYETTLRRTPLAPQRVAVAGWISLGCWILVIVLGRLTAYGIG